MRARFIGGPADGEWWDIEEGRPTVEVPERPAALVDDSQDPAGNYAIKVHVYRRLLIYDSKSKGAEETVEKFTLYVHSSISRPLFYLAEHYMPPSHSDSTR